MATGTAQPATTSADATQPGHRMPTTLAGSYNRPVKLGTVIGIGWRAAEVLDGAATARVLAPMRASIYIVARGEILWLGGPAEVMHPRAVLFSEPPDAACFAAGDALPVPRWTMRAWRPDRPQGVGDAVTTLRGGARRLSRTAAALGEPAGFGAWLTGAPLAFPLSGAEKAAATLESACAADDATAAAAAAAALLGLGAGLTPSGDDFVGGAFFARALLGELGSSDGAAWRRAAETVRSAARAATTPISAALLGDLMDGHGWSPLQELGLALASDDDAAATSAASRLIRLGHSSGWDLLSGFIAGTR